LHKTFFMSKENKIFDKSIEELIKQYEGQNEALEKILKQITNSKDSETTNTEKEQILSDT
jgi:hypothetical protein